MKLTTIDAVPSGEHVPTADERVVIHGVSWAAFEQFLMARGDRAPPRVAFLEGALEIMSPSNPHELIKTYLAEVVQTYLDAMGVPYQGVGSWLLKQRREEAGLEPDECYIIGDTTKNRPDLALEVEWTSGGLDKLQIYRRLGVPEVWIWKGGTITVYRLGARGYRATPTSRLLPGFDFGLVAEILKLPLLSDVRARLRTWLAAQG